MQTNPSRVCIQASRKRRGADGRSSSDISRVDRYPALSGMELAAVVTVIPNFPAHHIRIPMRMICPLNDEDPAFPARPPHTKETLVQLCSLQFRRAMPVLTQK